MKEIQIPSCPKDSESEHDLIKPTRFSRFSYKEQHVVYFTPMIV